VVAPPDEVAATLTQQPSAPLRTAATSPGPALKAQASIPELVNIPGGAFMMGSNDDSSEKPVHRVSVKAFSISRYPVTVREWKDCVAARACKAEPAGQDSEPMRNVSYNDAQEYVQWLSNETSQTYRLPTEAEWEYAARAGTNKPYWWGRQVIAGVADCKACGSQPDGPSPVGKFAPNKFGLHDIVGNVAQWVADCWHRDYHGAPGDGTAWQAPNCRERVLRGASWMSADQSDLRVTNRAYYDPGVRYPAHGFRVVRASKVGG